MANRLISKINEDNSRTNLYISKNTREISKVTHEGVKVVLSEDVELSHGLCVVPVEFSVNFCQNADHDFLYEAKCKNSKIEGISGILDTKERGRKVFLKTKIGEKHNIKLKKGAIVGTANTIVEMDETENNDSEWNLQELKDKIKLECLTEEQKQQVYEALFQAKMAFGKDDFDIGKANVSPHVIELDNYTPIWSKARRFPDPLNVEIEKQCLELEALDIIEKCDSKWSSPVVPVRKADGNLRLCVDYRKLNKVTKPDNFPIPNLSDSIYKGHNIKYFSKMDLIKGYYQVPIDEDSRQYTAFSTVHQQYQFKRLSFGLKNSGLQFQKNMQEILSEFKHKRIIVYQDDILIMSETYEEHLDILQRMLATLMRYGIKIKIGKCEFFKEQVSFLGHLIDKKGIRKAPEFIEKIENYPRPTNVTELRRFLGLANFQRKFLENFSTIARPLTALTGGPKRKVIQWSQEMINSFETLRTKLAEELYLSFPDYSKDAQLLELYVDASEVGAGACLMQQQSGEYKTIAYASTAFNKAEQNYAPIDREMLAIRWGVKNFRSFLFGIKFILYTDHKPLLHLKNMSNENARLMRTVNELEDYDFVIKYRPGVDNEAADSMSRIIPKPCEESTMLQNNELPKGIRLLHKIDGGGNSLFEALLSAMEDCKDELAVCIPDDHLDLRKLLVEYLLENPSKFKLKLDRDTKRMFKAMRNDGILPSEKVLLAACCLFNIEIQVHHGMKSPVMFKNNMNQETSQIIHLQCLSGVHYNPVVAKQNYINFVLPKYVNVAVETQEEIPKDPLEVDSVQQVNVQMILPECECAHMSNQLSKQVFSRGSVTFCSIVDTGAEISLISDTLSKRLIEDDPSLEILPVGKEVIGGIGNSKVPIIGIIELRIEMMNVQLDKLVPFAIVKDESL